MPTINFGTAQRLRRLEAVFTNNSTVKRREVIDWEDEDWILLVTGNWGNFQKFQSYMPIIIFSTAMTKSAKVVLTIPITENESFK